MDKLTSILAVVPQGGVDGVLWDKVARLVRHSGARVELFLTAPSDYFAIAARCAAMGCNGLAGITMHDGVTPLSAAVRARVLDMNADLLVAPRAQLDFEDCGVPVLLLGKSPWSAEPRFAAAVDVADPAAESVARGTLHAAGFLAEPLMAHVDVLYSEDESTDERVRMERAVKVARLVREYHIGSERLQIFEGPAARTLPTLIAERRYDILVVGTEPRHRVLLSALHSVSRKLIGATEGDVLMVFPRTPEPMAALRGLAGQQLANQA